MTIKANLTGSGIAPLASIGIAGGNISNSLTAAGTNQATALVLTSLNDIHVITTAAASTGAILPSSLSIGDQMVVVNGGANSITLFPPVGGKLNNGTANAGLTVASTKAAHVFCIDNLNFAVVVSA
jgi:hypothetical protein